MNGPLSKLALVNSNDAGGQPRTRYDLEGHESFPDQHEGVLFFPFVSFSCRNFVSWAPEWGRAYAARRSFFGVNVQAAS